MHRRCFMHAGCAFLLALFVSVPALGSSFHSFDSSNEGWQIVDFPFLVHMPTPATAALAFDDAFGNPAGSVRVGDVFNETGIMAPADHLGNQASIYGDTLRCDILIRFSDDVAYPAVVLNSETMSRQRHLRRGDADRFHERHLESHRYLHQCRMADRTR